MYLPRRIMISFLKKSTTVVGKKTSPNNIVGRVTSPIVDEMFETTSSRYAILRMRDCISRCVISVWKERCSRVCVHIL
jgi:hypothetical protein